jgi:serine O-acetyltransferase
VTYEYDGDAHEALADAYRADADPFLAEPGRSFPRRPERWGEIRLLKELLFPYYWNVDPESLDAAGVRQRLSTLGGEFLAGLRAYAGADDGSRSDEHCAELPDDPETAVDAVLDALPGIRETLKTDVEAAYKGDPAARSYTEVVRSYPGFLALLVYRPAHALYEQGGCEYARELTEHAKSRTGIDCHPGATIGEYCFVDHGTSVVVGETATIGDWVRIYQDVTLGALHFEAEEGEQHQLRKDYKRHPDIGDHVVIGAGSKVLGAIEVGDHVSIGANSWVTEDVPDYTTVYIADHPEHARKTKE